MLRANIRGWENKGAKFNILIHKPKECRRSVYALQLQQQPDMATPGSQSFKITSPIDDASVESSEPKKDDQENKGTSEALKGNKGRISILHVSCPG